MYQSSLILVENDPTTILPLVRNFEQEGARVQIFHDGISAFDYLKKNLSTDIVLTDWKIPSLDGLELCKLIKRSNDLAHIPVVMITDRDNEIDAVTALEVGAEDYIRKPIFMRELVTRVKKIIIRNKELRQGNGDKNFISEINLENNNADIKVHNGIKIDTYRHKAFLEDKELKLTYSEFKLLELFLGNPGRVYQRSTLIEKISGIDYYATERSVDVMVVGLRKKLGDHKKYLETVRGVGYRFIERE